MGRSRGQEQEHGFVSVRASDGARLWACVDSLMGTRDSRTPIVLLGPAEASHLRWPDSFVKDLVAAVGPVIRFDYRDVGRSAKSAKSYGIDRLVLDAKDVLDQLMGPGSAIGPAKKAHWVGFSMGAAIAMHAAIESTERMESLALIGATPGFELDLEPPAEWLLQRMAERGLRQPRSRLDKVAWICEQLEWFAGPRLRPAVGTRQEQATREVDHGWRYQPHHGEAMVEAPDRTEELAFLAVATTVVHGTADPVYPVDHAMFLFDQIPGARLELLEGIGHEIPHGRDVDLVRLLFPSSSAS